MLVLENTIFTFNQFPANNTGEYDETLDTTLMDDYTQCPYPLVHEKSDYDENCLSPGMDETNEGNSPVRRHRFSICKANDPQAIIAYRRLSNACSSIVPSPNINHQSVPDTPYVTPPLTDDHKKGSSNEEQGNVSPTLENSHLINASTSCPNLVINTDTDGLNSNLNQSPNSNIKEASSPFHTILTPNTFKAILSPDQIIDNSRNMDDQFRLFNYVDEDEDDDSDDDSLPSALNSNNQLDFDEDCDITLLNSKIRLNSNNNIRTSEIVTINQQPKDSLMKRLDKISRSEESKNLVEKSTPKKELKPKYMNEANEELIKSYSQNVQGIYGLWKDNYNLGFKSILRL